MIIIFRLNIELDKKRRDITNNNDWWWRVLYDENGEIDEQADWDGSWFLTKKLKEIIGISTSKSQSGTNEKEKEREKEKAL